eukprot:409713-Pelagomonas_calceolata.AAC.1
MAHILHTCVQFPVENTLSGPCELESAGCGFQVLSPDILATVFFLPSSRPQQQKIHLSSQ